MGYRKYKTSSTRVYVKSRHALYSRGKAKDFAWRGRKKNPIQKVLQHGYALRMKLYGILLFVSILGMLGLLVYHPFFHISHINTIGIERLDEEKIQQTVYGAMNYNKWFVFPAKSYIFVNTDEIASILNERFPLNQVIVKKQFPDTLIIQLEERLSTVLYDNGDAYHFMGLTGKIVEPVRKVTDAEWSIETTIVTSTNELGEEISEKKEIARHHIPDTHMIMKDVGEYPLIVDIAHGFFGTLDVNTEVVQESYVSQIVTWYETLQNEFSITPTFVDISSPYNTIIHTTGGQEIYITLPEGESGAQIERLRTALKEVPSFSNISYIDVRYPGRIYWQ